MPEPQHDVWPFGDFLLVHFGTLFDKKTPEHLIYRCSGVAFSLRRSLFLMKVVERLRFRAAPQPLHALGRLHFLGIVGRIPEDG